MSSRREDDRGLVADRWMAEARVDLDASKLLDERGFHSRALYMLQQANEKLAKGLLLSTGILTPKQLAKDWQTERLVGFVPKEPRRYGHRVVQSLLSDADKAVPSLERLFQLVNTGEFKPQVTRMKRMVKESGKGVRMLKRRHFGLVQTGEQLDREIEGATMILDRIGLAVSAMGIELKKLDQGKVALGAAKTVRKMGINVSPADVPQVGPIADGVVSSIRLSMISTVALALTSILDPLESVTRYPATSGQRFDETNPYVRRFSRLWTLVDRCLGMVKAGTRTP